MEKITTPFDFKYQVQILDAQGKPVSSGEGLNLVPVQGRTYYQNAALKKGPQYDRWYLGIFGNDTPITDVLTAQNIAAAMGELTSFQDPQRPELTLNDQGAGVFGNAAAAVAVRATASMTIRGAFIVSSPTLGGTNGVVVSVVQLPPQALEDGQGAVFTITQSLLTA